MLKAQELKLFCDKFCLEFPDFDIVKTRDGIYDYFTCNIIWNHSMRFEGKTSINKQESIISAINELSYWLNSEENFINVVLSHKNSMKF